MQENLLIDGNDADLRQEFAGLLDALFQLLRDRRGDGELDGGVGNAVQHGDRADKGHKFGAGGIMHGWLLDE